MVKVDLTKDETPLPDQLLSPYRVKGGADAGVS